MDPRRIVVSVAAPGAALITLLAGCGEETVRRPVAPTVAEAGSTSPYFVESGASLGITMDVDRAPRGDYFLPELMGTGGALLDYDGDGDLDLYIVTGARDASGAIRTEAGANRLFRQEATGQFTDVTEASGAGDRGFGMGVAAGDIDNDGDVDLYITNFDADTLLRNEGNGRFTDVTAAAGIDNDAWASSAGFIDVNGDGFLDLYVANYLVFDPEVKVDDDDGRPEYPGPVAYDGVPDLLYVNRGDGTFRDATSESGMTGEAGKGLGVLFADLDGDDRLDIYVANDGQRNVAWIADEDGGFTNRAAAMGLDLNAYAQPEASMGVAGGDLDGDGASDLYVTHLFEQTNTLYRKVAPTFYADMTIWSHLNAATLAMTGFGTAAGDFDLDGDLDLVVVNGRVLRREVNPRTTLTGHWAPYAEPDQLLLNGGDGSFVDAGAVAGVLHATVEVSRGLTVGDLDADGDLDLVVVNANGTIGVYRNEATRLGHWLVVRALEPALRRPALGAVIEITLDRDRTLRRTLRSAHSYLSSSPPEVHFGLGKTRKVRQITVQWPDGAREVFPGGDVDRVIELRRGAGTTPPDDE